MANKTVTVLIGNSDDKLTQKEWSNFVLDTKDVICSFGYDPYFFGTPVNYTPWQNAAWVIELPIAKIDELKQLLEMLRVKHKQESIAIVVGETEFVKA